MNSKTLLFILTVAALSSCSTAYNSGQTPEDVYYIPVRAVEENNQEERKQEENRTSSATNEEREIRWGVRDRRWRDWNNDYDYSYNNSPYGYCHCSCNNSGYYYNPYYSPWPVYNPKITPAPINSTPRIINLGGYKGYSNAVNSKPVGGSGTNWASPQPRYNNSNRESGLGRVVRQIFTPGSSSNNSNNNNSNNNTRTYTPSTSNNNTSSGSSNSSGAGAPVSRPVRGGN